MKIKSLFFILAGILVVGFSSSSQAAYVGTLGNDVTYTIGGDEANDPGYDINLQKIKANQNDLYQNYSFDKIGTLQLQNAAIVTGSDTINTIPGNLGANDHYLSIYGPSISSLFQPGKATFDLNSGFNTFSFEWGSIDSSNSLTVIGDNNKSYTLTGATLLADVTSLKAGTSSDYFSLTDLDGIKSVILSSTLNSFEVGNISASEVSAVPLPAALPLFGAALLGFALLRLRKQNQTF
jgi:hypothetical protein